MLTPAAFEDRRRFDRRIIALQVATGVCCGLLAVGFWIPQIVEHETYREAADNHYLKTIPLRAPRGVLYDRNGRVLVENTYSFTISVVRELSPRPDHNVDQTLHTLAVATGIDEDRAKDEVKRHRADPIFQPIALIQHATMSQVAAVSARKVELPEIVIEQEPSRTYPAAGLGAHLFGYVSEIQESQLERPEFSGLSSGTMVGQAGLEKVYNGLLMGTDGKRDITVNVHGREIEEMGEEAPVEGNRLQLTIDYDLQRALEEAFKANGFAGAAVFMDPRNGEVLALTSQPEFDPNDFANGLERSKWAELNKDPLKPLQDRLIQGLYQPGSTFKILMATAALSEGIITPDTKFTCTGSATFNGHTYQCDKHDGHGTLDLRHAIEQSCNVYFFNVGNLMKIDTIHEYAQRLGLIGKTGIDLPGEVESLVGSTEWKMKEKHERWYPGDTISVAIGQGFVSVTPISLATMMATVANGGTVVIPHLVKAVDEGDGWKPLAAREPRSVIPIAPEVLEPVRDGLWLTVNGEGTASRARVEGHDVLGKTGTAQVISKEGAAAVGKGGPDIRDNSWFVFYSSKDNPEIAGVVFAEHAGHGGLSSAPIARYVLETYFAKKDGRAMPTLVTDAAGDFKIVVGGPLPQPGKAGVPPAPPR